MAARLAARIALPYVFERGQDETTTITLYRGGSPVRPDNVPGTYVLRDEGGAEVASGAVSVGVDSVVSATVGGASPATRDYSDRWTFEWLLQVEGKLERVRNDAMLVRRKLYNVVTQEDLKRRHPQIVSENLPIESGDFSGPIDEAFEQFQRDLLGKGNRPNLIVSAWSCRDCVLSKALAIIYRDAITNAAGDTDRYEKLADFYAQEYHKRFPTLTYKVDESEDGTVAEQRPNVQPVVFLSGTPRSSGRGLSGD